MSDTAEIERSSVAAPRQRPEMFAELKARLAARGFVAEDEPPAEGYMPHAAFEREYQRAQDGSVRFPEPTDCAGTMVVLEKEGPVWTLRCDACGTEWAVRVPTDRLTEYLLERAGLPELFVGKDFDKRIPSQQPTLEVCRDWMRRFKPHDLVENIPAVALWGSAGRGKSHLLALIVETLIRKHNVEAAYRSVTGLLNELRTAAREGTFESAYSRVLSVPVLALDDLGAERMTDAAREWLAGLVDHRYSKQLPLLIATNVPPPAWDEVFGERTASRLRGMCLPFRLEGPDRRQGVQEALTMAAIAGE